MLYYPCNSDWRCGLNLAIASSHDICLLFDSTCFHFSLFFELLPSFIHSLVPSLTHSFLHSLTHSFLHSLVHHSFTTHSFTHRVSWRSWDCCVFSWPPSSSSTADSTQRRHWGTFIALECCSWIFVKICCIPYIVQYMNIYTMQKDLKYCVVYVIMISTHVCEYKTQKDCIIYTIILSVTTPKSNVQWNMHVWSCLTDLIIKFAYIQV